MPYTKQQFRKLKLPERYKCLKQDGTHIGVRMQGVHRIHLFAYAGFYVEIWIIISLDQIHWIEIQENNSILSSYAEQVDIKKDLGL